MAPEAEHVARSWRDHGIHIAVSMNNVENAFMPQGYEHLDPLTLTCLEVWLFQVGTESGWMELWVCGLTLGFPFRLNWGGGNKRRVSLQITYFEVIKGVGRPDENASDSLVQLIGGPADFVLIHDASEWQSAVLSPSFERTTVFGGRKVAR